MWVRTQHRNETQRERHYGQNELCLARIFLVTLADRRVQVGEHVHYVIVGLERVVNRFVERRLVIHVVPVVELFVQNIRQPVREQPQTYRAPVVHAKHAETSPRRYVRLMNECTNEMREKFSIIDRENCSPSVYCSPRKQSAIRDDDLGDYLVREKKKYIYVRKSFDLVRSRFPDLRKKRPRFNHVIFCKS